MKNAKVIGFSKSGLAQSIYAELKEHRINLPSDEHGVFSQEGTEARERQAEDLKPLVKINLKNLTFFRQIKAISVDFRQF